MTDRTLTSTSDESGAPEFTGAWLRHLIESQNVLKGSYKTPSALRLHAIAERLETFRALAHLEETGARAADGPNVKAKQALDVLSEVLPILKSRSEEWIAKCRDLALSPDEYPVIRDLIDADDCLANFIRSVAAASTSPIIRPAFSAVPRVLSWKDFALEISEAFREVLQATNPGKKVGVANGGPVARFIVAVAPHVTGEELKPESVGRTLRDEDKLN